MTIGPTGRPVPGPQRPHTDSSVVIRQPTRSDCAAVARIYNHYVENTIITFEEVVVDEAEMWERMSAVQRARLPWLVAEQGGDVIGYAFASPWKSRSAYRFSVEATVYVQPEVTARGIGSALYNGLFAELRPPEVHAVVGGIALPNDASIALHEKFGLVKVAHFKEIGFKFGRWIDVGYWQRLL